MIGTITSYNSSTGSLTITVNSAVGVGNLYSSWGVNLSGLTGTSGTSGTGFTTISTPLNNRVLTSDGSSNAAVAETNMTFDGNILAVTGTVSTTNFQMTNGASNGYILSTDATGVGSWTSSNPMISLAFSGTVSSMTASTNTNVGPFIGGTLGDTNTVIFKFNNVVSDTLGGYSTSTGIWTCPQTGNYLFNVFATLKNWNGSSFVGWPANTFLNIGVVLNGSNGWYGGTIIASNQYLPAALNGTLTTMRNITSGTQISLQGLLQGSTNYAYHSGDNMYFTIQLIR